MNDEHLLRPASKIPLHFVFNDLHSNLKALIVPSLSSRIVRVTVVVVIIIMLGSLFKH